MRRVFGIIACLLAQAGTGAPETPVSVPSKPPSGLGERARPPGLGTAMEFDRLRTEGIRAYVEKDYKRAARYFEEALRIRPDDEVTRAWLHAAKYKIAAPTPKPSAAPSGPSTRPGDGPVPSPPPTPPSPPGASPSAPALPEQRQGPAIPSPPMPPSGTGLPPRFLF